MGNGQQKFLHQKEYFEIEQIYKQDMQSTLSQVCCSLQYYNLLIPNKTLCNAPIGWAEAGMYGFIRTTSSV